MNNLQTFWVLMKKSVNCCHWIMAVELYYIKTVSILRDQIFKM